MWNHWALQAGDDAPTLKYIFKHHIITTSTKSVMEQATDQDFVKNEVEWPGIVFSVLDLSFPALMGTPHGKGVAFMLLDHPNELREKDIEFITMFSTSHKDEGVFNLFFTLSG